MTAHGDALAALEKAAELAHVPAIAAVWSEQAQTHATLAVAEQLGRVADALRSGSLMAMDASKVAGTVARAQAALGRRPDYSAGPG